MNVNLYVTEDYENKTTLRPQKNKPKQTQSRNNSKSKGALGGLGNLLIGKIGNIITFFLTFTGKLV